ncbi:MAG: 3-dehydroquinate synthase [Actinomycetota bacterium]|nr:3-dehydroquinate synthase [Actinomycetota bacterium]MDP9480109.1 3-dehydroquinate synthase [Actinomycetota bacterium]
MPAHTVEVRVARPYPVVVGDGLDLVETLSRSLEPGLCAVLTDSTVGPLHAAAVREDLERAGWRMAGVLEVPAGESSKSLTTYARTVRELARLGLTRDATLFALGGGVVGDLGGFVAGTYMRGVDLVMLPTSLLAMVDSSVGGKVGVDLPEGKNLVGAFVRPRLVAADLDWLRTLPERELSNGLAESVKMGLLAGGTFFDDLVHLLESARAGDPEALLQLVLHSVRFKAHVVAEDELEGGMRAILNYGHTVGHALEAAAGYALAHGSAVAAGMVAAARLSRERLGTDLMALHEALISTAGLPLRVPRVDTREALLAMRRDKKRPASATTGGEHRFVLLEDVGRPLRGVPVDEKEVARAIEAVVE